MIPDDQIEEVRTRADIVDIVGEVVPLKKSGKDYKGKCPFHEDKTPSFYVVPAKGFYNCFGCGESGDAFAFVMKRMGLDFVEAVKYVARKTGVTVREVTRRQAQEDPFRPFYEANAFARGYYRELLEDPELGRGARSYLEGRGIDAETAERFGLGFAPDEWRGLRTAANRHGIDDRVLLDVGLTTTSEKADEPYDRFRSRIVFPIEGLGGRVLAFGGRLIGSGKGAKYLNSPETPIYTKGEVLYGLHWARHAIRKEESALVVEGYMDAVSLAAHGIPHAVAPLGTAMTTEQARLLARYTAKVYLLFDSDTAGLRATFRNADLLLSAGIHPSAVTLPPGEDPDSVVRAEGREKLLGYVADAVDVLDRKLQILEEKDRLSTIDGIRNSVDRLLPTLRAVSDPALRDIYVSKVAEKTGVRIETLQTEMARSASTPAAPVRPRPSGPRGRAPVPEMGAERTLLELLVRAREWIDAAAESLGPEDFVDPANRAIFQALTEEPELSRPPDGMDSVAARRLTEMLASGRAIEHAHRVLHDSVSRIKGKPLGAKARELRDLISRESGEERKEQLVVELERLEREKREIDRTDWTSAIRSRKAPGANVEPSEWGP